MEKKQIQEMIDLAIRQMDYSYAPYSHFHVGSAVLSEDNSGRISVSWNMAKKLLCTIRRVR